MGDSFIEITVGDWYNLYKNHTFKFLPGLTCLIGKNGSGKSTLLKEIQEWAKENKIKCHYYDNDEREKGAMEEFMFAGKYDKVARNYGSSEGQNIRNNFEDDIVNIGAYIRTCKQRNYKNAIILLDGLDSGISMDYVFKLKKELFPLILEDCQKDNINPYIIISANNYEFCNGEDCIRVSDAKHFRFNSYDDFRKIYIKKGLNDKNK